VAGLASVALGLFGCEALGCEASSRGRPSSSAAAASSSSGSAESSAEPASSVTDRAWDALDVDVVGAAEPSRLVVLLHGWGADGDDLRSLARQLAADDAAVLLPTAPLDRPGGGRAWWHLDLAARRRALAQGKERDLSGKLPDGMTAASDLVVRLIDEATARYDVAPSDVAVAGFSQGAMLATDVALALPKQPAALAVLSGTLVAEDRWRERQGRARGLPVFLSHGRGDSILPFSMAQRLRAFLEDAGAEVTFVPFSGGHGIPAAVARELEAFLAQRE
jgi:phospholipase/carboxylesterase